LPPEIGPWAQPVWTSATNAHGTISASGTYGLDYPWKAYNGIVNDGNEWAIQKTYGNLTLALNYPIYVEKIEIYNIHSFLWHHTKYAYFINEKREPLGAPFVMANANGSYASIDVGGVWVTAINLFIDSSYGAYVGASEIIITAKYNGQSPVITGPPPSAAL
jgi:hypothetical protein